MLQFVLGAQSFNRKHKSAQINCNPLLAVKPVTSNFLCYLQKDSYINLNNILSHAMIKNSPLKGFDLICDFSTFQHNYFKKKKI